jgi:hypothetical protein
LPLVRKDCGLGPKSACRLPSLAKLTRHEKDLGGDLFGCTARARFFRAQPGVPIMLGTEDNGRHQGRLSAVNQPIGRAMRGSLQRQGKACFFLQFSTRTVIRMFTGPTSARRWRPSPIAFIIRPLVRPMEEQELYRCFASTINDHRRAERWIAGNRQSIVCPLRHAGFSSASERRRYCMVASHECPLSVLFGTG